jgi:CPA2 family monovalent cation:H+ antiporter-2
MGGVMVHETQDFLGALAVVLCAAALTTVVFQRLRQPVVLGYILAGVIVGPHVAIPLVADSTSVETLAELGVILLMFSLGLEFSLRKLAQVGPTAGLTAVVETSFMLWLGLQAGRLLGWSPLESLFAGAVVAISSTTIIVKAFAERSITGRLRDIVVGVLIVEDLIAILLLAILTVVSSDVATESLAVTVGRLAAVLGGLLVVGMLLVPRAMRAIVRLDRRETTLVASLGICFAFALLARAFGYSVALGAFLAGSLVAESGRQYQIEPLIEPVRDMFVAVFFVSVGMLIDPGQIVRHLPAVALLTSVVLVGKMLGVSLGTFLTGNGLRISVEAGMSMAQIGEFSFIIAGLGLTMRAGVFLYPVAVAVSAVTALLTPWLIRAAGPVSLWVDRKLPRPLQTFAALYGSWVERLRTGPRPQSAMARVRRQLRLMALDAALITGIIVGAAASYADLTTLAERRLGLPGHLASPLLVLVAVTLAAPFGLGLVQGARHVGITLARLALPTRLGRSVDTALVPRRMLVVTLQLAAIVLMGLPMLALTQPFLPGVPGAVVLALIVAVLGVAFWRTATNLQGHVRAGAEVILGALAAQLATASAPEPGPLTQAERLLPGLGTLESVRVERDSPAVGKTLAELNLRGRTGATVLAIIRRDEQVAVPGAAERLREEDVLALAGSGEAIRAARSFITGHPARDTALPPDPPAA